MTVGYSKTFIKQSKKLSPDLRQKLYQRITLFVSNPLDPALRNHALKGKYRQYRSMDITGDIRALYTQRGDNYIFEVVGTHSQLYS
jgi:addiction module RelE/StbE family toxin